MLGPLPTYYRILVSVVAFVAFAGLGSWAAWLLPDSVLASIGTGLGIGLGAVAALLLVLDHGHDGHDPRARVRASRR